MGTAIGPNTFTTPAADADWASHNIVANKAPGWLSLRSALQNVMQLAQNIQYMEPLGPMTAPSVLDNLPLACLCGVRVHQHISSESMYFLRCCKVIITCN